jgi:hypothetical protein
LIFRHFCIDALQAVRLGDEGRKDASVGEIYASSTVNGGFAVVFFNREWGGGGSANMTLEAADILPGDTATAVATK